MGLSVTFTVYDAKQKGYVRISSNDDKFSSKKEFIDYVKKNMSVVNLFDWRTADDIDQAKKGYFINISVFTNSIQTIESDLN